MQINPDGSIQLEPSDVLPREVAVKTDDPPHIVAEIEHINSTIKTAQDLVSAVLYIGELRKKHHGVTNPDIEAVYQKVERAKR